LAVPGRSQQTLDADSYVRIVLRAHPGARVQAGLLAGAEAEAKGVWLPPDPRVEYSRAHAHPPDAAELNGIEDAFVISQTLPWPGTTAAAARAARQAAEGLHAERRAASWAVEAAAREAFGKLVVARALAGIDGEAETEARSLRDLVARRTELGDTRESDRIRARVEWMRQRRLLEASRREAAAAEALVRLLAVEPLPEPLVLAAEPPRRLAPLDRDQVLKRLHEHNPELLGARAEAARQGELVSQAKRSRLPDLDLSFFRERELDKDANGFSVAIKLPLWNAGRGEIARAQAASTLAAARAERRRLELALELEERLREVDVAGVQVQTLQEEILPAAAESLRLARRSYEEGESSLLDLLDAQRTFRETQREAVLSRLALVLAVTDLQRLVGPDFDPWRQS
jgi:cobalt-zinc-cadmium efflux system outer membrane protein